MKTLGYLAVLFCSCAGVAPAPERSTIARVADLVVVGYFHEVELSPRPDGWTLRGKILIAHTLYGSQRSGKDLKYEFQCDDCPKRPVQSIAAETHGQMIWFLTDGKGDVWNSAGTSHGDPGGRPMHELEYYLKVLRRRAED